MHKKNTTTSGEGQDQPPEVSRNGDGKPEGKRKGWVMVRDDVLATPGLSDAALRAWLALDQWAFKGKYPSNAELAKACGWESASKAKRVLRELERHGIVKRHTAVIGAYLQRTGLDVEYPGPKASCTQPCTGGSKMTQGVGQKRPRGGSNLTRSLHTIQTDSSAALKAAAEESSEPESALAGKGQPPPEDKRKKEDDMICESTNPQLEERSAERRAKDAALLAMLSKASDLPAAGRDEATADGPRADLNRNAPTIATTPTRRRPSWAAPLPEFVPESPRTSPEPSATTECGIIPPKAQAPQDGPLGDVQADPTMVSPPQAVEPSKVAHPDDRSGSTTETRPIHQSCRTNEDYVAHLRRIHLDRRPPGEVDSHLCQDQSQLKAP